MSLSSDYPSLIHVNRHAANGCYPEVSFYAQAIAALNHVLAYRRKVIYHRAWPLGLSGGASGVVCRWHCKTGYAAKRLVVFPVLGFDDRALADDPYISVAIAKEGGSTTTLDFHGGVTHTASVDAPEQWLPQIQTCDVDAASTYTGAVTFNDNVRLISLTVFEDTSETVDETLDFFSAWEPGAGSPIYDSRQEQLLTGVGGIVRLNRGLRFDYSKDDGNARTRASTTLANLHDTSVTGTPTSSTPGVTFVTSYRNTYAATTIPCRLAVYASMSAGSGTVSMRDTGGSDIATVTVDDATPAWFVADGALTVGSAVKLDPMFVCDSSAHTLSVYALSFYEIDDPPVALSFRITAHGLTTGDGPFTLTTTGALPTGYATSTDYYAIVTDADHYLLATSRANALASTSIALSDAGTGTHTLVTGGALQNPTSLTFSEDFTGNAGDEVATFAAPHGLSLVAGPFRATTTGTLPAGLATGTDYWSRDFDGSSVQLFASLSDAGVTSGAGGSWVSITDAGTGTHTLTAQAGAELYGAIALPDSTFTVE